jgi:hypothetical protein
MSTEIVTTLIASILGVVIGATANYLFAKKKMDAEIRKIEAETEKTKIEAEKLRAEKSEQPLSPEAMISKKEGRTVATSLPSSPGKNVFWQTMLGLQPGKKVYVLPSAKHGFEWEQGVPTSRPGHTPLLSYNETVVFVKLRDRLSEFGEKTVLLHGGIEDLQTKKIYIPEFPDDETLIIIGSPNANKLCQRILASPKLAPMPFRFEKNEMGKCINVYQDETGKWSEKPITCLPALAEKPDEQVEDIEEDYGIIIRITNPRDVSEKNKVLIMGGNHGLGTESAVNFVLDQERVSRLDELVQEQDFAAVFQASVSKRQGLGIGIRKLAARKNGVWVPIKVG